MNLRRILRPLVALALLESALSGAPAHAGVPLLARVWLTGESAGPNSATFCAGGRVDDPPAVAGVWILRVTGAGTSGAITAGSPLGSGPTFSGCVTVSAGIGVADASLTFVGVGGDVTAFCTMPAVTLPMWQPIAAACLDQDPTRSTP